MRAILLAFLVVAAALFVGQRKLMYFPRMYPADFVRRLIDNGLVRIRFMTPSGEQCAYYRAPSPPPAADTLPESIWVLFGGNGSLALDWVMFLPPDENRRAGLLFVDYPGYGECDGRTTRNAIRTTLAALVPALASEWHASEAEVASRLKVAGHSLGAAVALEFAEMHPVTDIVLIAPFTSMKDMARQVVGWPLCEVLLDRYDNRAALDNLATRQPRPTLRIFHGADDALILPRMGRELADRQTGWAEFHEVTGTEHVGIAGEAVRQCDFFRR